MRRDADTDRTICGVGAMMRKLDNRGIAALEMTLVFVPLFALMFVIFDLGRYAITRQSLNALADAGARAVMISCYTPAVAVNKTSPSGCTNISAYLPTTAKQNAAPFLFSGGLTPTLAVAAGAKALTVTASQPGFTMLMPIWGTALNAPSASTTIPF
jgi:Flp pilus assembly protein TadG